jgi:hypothetical protein
VLHADDFKCVQNACDESISFGNEVLFGAHVATDLTNEGSDEELIVKLIFSRDSMINVDLLCLKEDRRFERQLSSSSKASGGAI